jgi:uncharacterized protein YqgC (DUF456 family)
MPIIQISVWNVGHLTYISALRSRTFDSINILNLMVLLLLDYVSNSLSEKDMGGASLSYFPACFVAG